MQKGLTQEQVEELIAWSKSYTSNYFKSYELENKIQELQTPPKRYVDLDLFLSTLISEPNSHYHKITLFNIEALKYRAQTLEELNKENQK